jgi:hypothetical protein
MSGLERIVVGHRKGSRKVQMLEDQFGLHAVAVRNCMAGCGYPVYFYSGGIDAVRERDAEVVCEECRQQYYPELMAEI